MRRGCRNKICSLFGGRPEHNWPRCVSRLPPPQASFMFVILKTVWCDQLETSFRYTWRTSFKGSFLTLFCDYFPNSNVSACQLLSLVRKDWTMGNLSQLKYGVPDGSKKHLLSHIRSCDHICIHIGAVTCTRQETCALCGGGLVSRY